MPMQREKHVAYWLRLLAEGERRLGKSARKLFAAQGRNASTAYAKQASIAAVTEVIAKGQSDWQKVLNAHYAVTISHVVDYTKASLIGGKSAKKNFSSRIQDFINEQGLKKSKLITATTIDQAKKIINDGQANGDSEAVIAAALSDGIGGELESQYRSSMIARTETHNAATYAMQETAEEIDDQNNFTVTRSWVAVDDERTRPEHAQAQEDNQDIGMDEPFMVGGEALDRPGDDSGSAWNVINCRCVIEYSIKDAMGNDTANESDNSSEDDVGAGGFLND